MFCIFNPAKKIKDSDTFPISEFIDKVHYTIAFVIDNPLEPEYMRSKKYKNKDYLEVLEMSNDIVMKNEGSKS